MAKTFIDGNRVRNWFLDGVSQRKGYLDGQLVYLRELVVNITANDVNYTAAKLKAAALAANGGEVYTGGIIRVVIASGITIIGDPAEAYSLTLDTNSLWSNDIIVENYGNIAGNGGNGGVVNGSNSVAAPGDGKPAILANNLSVTIYNSGLIAGGGGGGGATYSHDGGSGNYYGGGGGGSPRGVGGAAYQQNYYAYGSNATLDLSVGGIGGRPVADSQRWGGNGGAAGYDGQGGNVKNDGSGTIYGANPGGKAGKAIVRTGGGTLTVVQLAGSILGGITY